MFTLFCRVVMSLNESPSEKEGKSISAVLVLLGAVVPSMKVPPKRKGNSSLPEHPELECHFPQ